MEIRVSKGSRSRHTTVKDYIVDKQDIFGVIGRICDRLAEKNILSLEDISYIANGYDDYESLEKLD